MLTGWNFKQFCNKGTFQFKHYYVTGKLKPVNISFFMASLS